MSMLVKVAGDEVRLKFSYPPPREKDEVKRLGARYVGESREWILPITTRTARWLSDHGVEVPATATVAQSTTGLSHPEIADADQPEGIAVALFPYQRQGVAFLDTTPRALLADEQGFGKIFQFLLAGRHTDRAIVLTPTSSAWQTINDGVLKLWPDLDPAQVAVLAAGGGAKKQQALLDRLPEAQWIVCPYSLVSKYAATLAALPGSFTLIADEAQALKSAKAHRSKAAQLLASRADRVVLATGSPLMNQKPIELYPLLQLLNNPLKLSYPQFGMRYCAGQLVEARGRIPSHYDFTGASYLPELRERMAPFTIRRTKSEVLPDLPPKILTRVPLDLAPAAAKEYALCSEDYLMWRESYRPDLSAEPLSDNAPLDLMLPGALRQIAAEAKAELAVEWVTEFLEGSDPHRKIIVFSDYLDPLATVKAGLSATGHESVVISGAVTGEDRESARQRFQSDPRVRVCLAQMQTAGVALNLTAADTVLFLNMPWRAMDVSQAFDRIHRPGQDAQSVQAVFLEMHTAEGDNIDTALYQLVLGKQEVADALLGKSSTDLSAADALPPDDVKKAVIASLGLRKTVAKAERQIRGVKKVDEAPQRQVPAQPGLVPASEAQRDRVQQAIGSTPPQAPQR